MSWSRSPPSPPSPPTPRSQDWEESPVIETQEEYYYRMNPHLEFDTPLEQNRFILTPPPHDDADAEMGVAYHVHQAFDNINENLDQITDTLGGPHYDLHLFSIGPEEFLNAFFGFCQQVLQRHYSGPEHNVLLDKTSQIVNKLSLARVGYLTEENISFMFTCIMFVLRQPDTFQKYYVDLYIEDTFHAYNGAVDTISCPKGIIERVLLTIADTCIIYCSQHMKKPRKKTKKNKKKQASNKTQTTSSGGRAKPKSTYSKCDNATYRKLIRLFKKEVPDLNALSKSWAAILDDPAEIATMTEEDLKVHFIKYMTKKYELYGLVQKEQILKRAKEYEDAEVFKRREFG